MAPIRLAEFTNTFHIGGGEVQFVELLRGLSREQYEISVLALEESGPLLEPVRAMGYRPQVFPLNGSIMKANTAKQIAQMARWLREQRIDLVHVHDFYTTLLAVPAAKLAGAKVVVGRLDLVHWHGPARHTALAGLSHLADHVIANADAVRRFLIERERLPDRRISVILNGLDLARFDARRAEGPLAPLPEVRGPVAILVANMNHEVKRQEDFLEALASARREQPALEAFLVGDGERRPYLEQRALQLGLSQVVHFLGRRMDVPALLSRASLGVLCSSQEGLSNAVMEGMAAGLPMVVTDAGGNAELVENGRRGYVVPVQQPEALARAMLQLLSNPERAHQYGSAARRFVEQQLSLERMVAAHDALFRGLLHTGAPAPFIFANAGGAQ